MNKRALAITGTTLYVITIGVFLLLLVTEPLWFDIKTAAIYFVSALLLFALGPAYYVASKGRGTLLITSGTIALAILLTFIALFAVAGVAWLIALSHT